MITYSIIIPVLNEEAVIQEMYNRLTGVMTKINESYEIIFINDGSIDGSKDIIKTLISRNNLVKLIDLSRNFGHQVAIAAGIDYAQGKAVVIMDADLQDPPETILEMITKWKEGYEVVYGVRRERIGETFFKKITAKYFYRLLARITNINIPSDAGDFRLLDRKVVDALKRMHEYHRFIRGLASWVGFKSTGVYYIRDERYAGKTKFSVIKMIKFALDGITSFSYIPLQLATYLGLIVALFSFLGVIIALFLKIFFSIFISGLASLLISILFLGGVQLIFLGIIGEYIGRIYDEVKRRPLYIVNETVGFRITEPEKV
ncbi:MAG: glycosyltransferase [Flavobacterium sp.]|nr:glycosyltransferase [Flavobacterium sp.]